MPELPEVEVTLKRVAPELIGERIKDVSVYWQRTVNAVPVAEFKRTLKGAQFKNYQRRGKYLIFELSKRRRTKILAVHLRMSGRLEVLEPGVKRRKHDRVIISLKSGSRLAFHDTRKFGRIYLADSTEEIVSGLGIEPLSEEFTSRILINLLKGRRRMIKPLLLDQSVIAGLGNIYVDESLWRAGIHPEAIAAELRRHQVKKLYRSIRTVLRNAIRKAGTDNGDNVVNYGDYSPAVYGRAGRKCGRCRKEIIKIIVSQRGTHICPGCQKL